MKEKIRELKNAFRKATNDEEYDIIDTQMQKLINENADEFSESMLELMKESVEHAGRLVLKQRMKNVIPAISLSYIAKNYFDKTESWLYQRLNENTVNGKPAVFTLKEIEIMKFALNDLSKKLGSLSMSL